jgi:ABC-type branched-subunit amino acid transport system ATPase component
VTGLEGIMPLLVDEMFAPFRAMKAQRTTVLLVEQNVEPALDIADRYRCAGSGRRGLSRHRERALPTMR